MPWDKVKKAAVPMEVDAAASDFEWPDTISNIDPYLRRIQDEDLLHDKVVRVYISFLMTIGDEKARDVYLDRDTVLKYLRKEKDYSKQLVIVSTLNDAKFAVLRPYLSKQLIEARELINDSQARALHNMLNDKIKDKIHEARLDKPKKVYLEREAMDIQ